MGLTRTAKEGQEAVVDSLKAKFTLRNSWFKQNTPVGIKVQPATKDKLQSAVYTAAKFLPIHEEGGTKIPFRNWIAVPTANAQPNKSKRIPQKNLPKNLQNAFIMVTKSGTRILAIRKIRGKDRGVVPMYVLTPRAKEPKREFFYGTIKKVVDRKLTSNISSGIDKALATMK